MQIIDLLKKLIAQEKSERALGNLAAAETFAAKAAELLFKHKLEMSDIEIAEEEAAEPIMDEFFSAAELLDLPQKKTHDNWIGILLMGVCESNFCKLIRSHGSNTFNIVGRSTDRAATVAMFSYLSRACIEMAPREAIIQGVYERHRSFVSSFKLGFAGAIQRRLARKREELKAGLALGGKQEQGLMRIDQMEKAVESKFKEFHPDAVTCAPARTYHHGGYRAGRTYGESVGINNTKRLGASA